MRRYTSALFLCFLIAFTFADAMATEKDTQDSSPADSSMANDPAVEPTRFTRGSICCRHCEFDDFD